MAAESARCEHREGRKPQDHSIAPGSLSHPFSTMSDMAQRFILIQGDDVTPDWKLDPQVRERGRAGVASARAALQAAKPRFADDAAA